ncbi:hypothetical protein CW748_02595 [Alteromonadales bacterium alter-6D02]|nr:hypothetical protein CW748_02595 [Alteromonadales bacterium alter-6D02]
MKFRKALVCLAISAALSACGDSDKKDVVTSQPDQGPAPVKTVVTGVAIKGVLSNARVTPYKFVNNEAVMLTEDELEDAEIITDADGNYTVTLLDYDGPLKVVISPITGGTTPTEMLCDVQDGCGEVEFGGKINLSTNDPDFSLSAISHIDKDVVEPVRLNVSAVTHLASSLIESKETIDASTITTTLSQVGNTLGIIGDINTLAPTNINSTQDIVDEDNENELKYGLINAAIASSLFAGGDGATQSQKLAQAAQDLVDNDGEFLVNQDDDDDFELALSDVLSLASSLAHYMVANIQKDFDNAETTALIESLSQRATNLTNEAVVKQEQANDDGRITPISDKIIEGGNVDIAAGLIEDIRVFANLFDLNKASGQDVDTKGEAAIKLSEDASLMVDAEVEKFTLVSTLGVAISNIQMAMDAGTATGTVFQLADWLTGTTSSATGTVTFDPENYQFMVNATEGSEKATLDIVLEQSEDQLSVSLNLSGELESTGAKLTLATGSMLKVSFDEAVTKAQLDMGEVPMPSAGEVSLEVTLTQLATEIVTNPLSFTGKVSTQVMPVLVPKVVSEWQVGEGESQIIEEYDILPKHISLSGEFSSLAGDRISATLTIDSDNAQGYQAAGLAHYGRKFEQNYQVTVSQDGRSIVESLEGGETFTYTFTPGANAGHWDEMLTITDENPKARYGEGFERTLSFRTNSTALGDEYIYAYHSSHQNTDYIYSQKVSPIDSTDDGVANEYRAYTISRSYDKNSPITDDNKPIPSFTNTWEFEYPDGEMVSFSEEDFSTYATANDYFAGNQFLNGNAPMDVTSSLSMFKDRRTSGRSLYNGDFGILSVNDYQQLSSLSNGDSLTLNTYLSEELLADAYQLDVSADANEITLNLEQSLVSSLQLDLVSPANFLLTQRMRNDYNEMLELSTIKSQTDDIGLKDDRVTVTYHMPYFARVVTYTPLSIDADSSADSVEVCDLWGDDFNADGLLIDYDGDLVIPQQDNCYTTDSFDNAFSNDNYLHYMSPYEISSALTVANHIYNWSSIQTYLQGVGVAEGYINADDVVAGSSHTFDAWITEPDQVSGLESEDQFLNVNAALSVGVTLADYDVNLTLNGKRTALEDGELNLTATYQLPGEDAQRTFTISYITTEQQQVTIANEQGTSVVLTVPEQTDADEQVTLGIITVNGEEAAEVVMRGKLLLVIYANGTVESL